MIFSVDLVSSIGKGTYETGKSKTQINSLLAEYPKPLLMNQKVTKNEKTTKLH